MRDEQIAQHPNLLAYNVENNLIVEERKRGGAGFFFLCPDSLLGRIPLALCVTLHRRAPRHGIDGE